MSQSFLFFVGIDWGTEKHSVCVLDREGNKVAECQALHSGTGLQQLLDWLRKQTGVAPDQVACGIEAPAGAVVDTLLAHRYPGFHINPKQMDRFRDRHTVAGVKDDSLDAYVIADSLRTDRPCFHPIQVDDPQNPPSAHFVALGRRPGPRLVAADQPVAATTAPLFAA